MENKTGTENFDDTDEIFKAEKLDESTWVLMNRQVYDPVPGMMGGELYAVFTKSRDLIEVRIGELTYDAQNRIKQGSYLSAYGYDG